MYFYELEEGQKFTERGEDEEYRKTGDYTATSSEDGKSVQFNPVDRVIPLDKS